MIAVVQQRAVRVLGWWAVGKGELYRQIRFFLGEGMRLGVMGVMLDMDDVVQEKMDMVAETAVKGIEAVKRWILADNNRVG